MTATEESTYIVDEFGVILLPNGTRKEGKREPID